nr:solute carrier family 2, facilitated glucose transporter member 5-like isoform X1 [Anolis sagrei ordinatus]
MTSWSVVILMQLNPNQLCHNSVKSQKIYLVNASFSPITSQVLISQSSFTGAAFYMSLTGIMAICNIIMWHYVPESPRFLFIQKEDESAAREALKKLRGESNLEEELEEMRVESICERDKKHLNAVKLLSCRDLQKPLLSAVLLMMGNQLTGINGVYVYAERVYTNMRFEGRHIRFSLIVVNVVMHVALIIMTNFIDYMGRRFLLLLGFMVCSITCIILAVTLEFQAQYMSVMPYFSSFVIIIFLIGHMIGPGPIPYLLTGELFLQSSRGTAYMLSGFMNWLTRTLVSVIFIFLEPEIGPYSLVLFWPFCVGIFIYVFKKVPETKGRTFVEIWKGTGSPKRMQKKSSRKKDKSQSKRVK